ncbi:MAG TPA: T9SS type A sorting domain-containing protein [Bacteroidia bacterium]|jgi:hypothetical protein|nr:T9SS type A sorting domain-containing protein [Bacteroidia bacterium]
MGKNNYHIRNKFVKAVSVCTIVFTLSVSNSFAQVINNSGAVINITGNTGVTGGSLTNTSGTVSNAGTITLTANYSNTGNVIGNGAYNIGGNWSNSGIFTAGNSNVTFNGASLQTISGSVPTAFYNITVNGTGIKLSQNASFTRILTLTAGTISGSDTMTLISNAAGDAMIAPVGPAVTQSSITATFTVQRYENIRTKANYASLSSPMLNTTLGDWNVSNRNPKFYMSGIGGPDGLSGTYVSVKRDNEVTNAYDNITLYASPGINYVIRQGEGLYLWEGTGLTTMITPFSFNTHGRPTIGNVSIGVTYTAAKGKGFNLLGNPYAAPIDWGTFLASNPTLQSSYYIFEQDGTWHAFTSGSIPIEQGFGVITSSATTINFMESQKTMVDANLLRPINPSDAANTGTFILSDDSNEFSCPTIISFDPSYVKNYNSAEDAYFIKSYVETVPQLYTVSEDDNNLMLNSLPDIDNTMDVRLTAVAGVQANYTLTAKNIENISSYNCVVLLDAATGAILANFKDSPSYTFNLANATDKKDFIVRFTKLAAGQSCNSVVNSSKDGVGIYPSTAGAYVNFNLNESEDAVISVYNILGQEVIPVMNRTVQSNVIEVPFPFSEAIYIVKVETKYGIFTQKIYHK